MIESAVAGRLCIVFVLTLPRQPMILNAIAFGINVQGGVQYDF